MNRQENYGGVAGDEQSNEGADELDLNNSIGFKLFLKRFRRGYKRVPKDEAIRQATYVYSNMSPERQDHYRQVAYWKRQERQGGNDFLFLHAPQDKCCDKKSCIEKKNTCLPKPYCVCCEPDSTGSLGFRNYFKMYRCRFPYYSKCTALAKAYCKYCQLGRTAKGKYRLMGCNPKICCKPRYPCPC